MKGFVLALAVAVTLLTNGCSKKGDQMNLSGTEVLKISVFKSGEMKANGKVVSMEELDGLLAASAQKKGVVWYYREAGNEEPPPQAMQAIELIAKHKRPISMSSKPDFSDTIDQDGSSRPRKN